MKQIIKRFSFIVILCLISISAFSQNEWEGINSSHFTWSDNEHLKIYSKTLSRLTLWNYNAISNENLKNKVIPYLSVTMNTPDSSWCESQAWRITFNIKNRNNDSRRKYLVVDQEGNEKWYKKSICWGFEVSTKSLLSDKPEHYSRFYSDMKKPINGQYAAVMDSDSRQWRSDIATAFHAVSIEYDGHSTITIKTDGHIVHTFSNAKNLSSIKIHAGTAAYVEVTEFIAERKTLYGEAKPFIIAAKEKTDKGDLWGAISDYTTAIDKGYKNYNVYYRRAMIYYSMNYFNNAIDDLTNALSYRKTEDAYLYRGLSKWKRNDRSAIEDLKLGGQKGIAMAKEILGESETEGTDNNNSKYLASGSGFFIDSSGYIATNFHVIDGANGIDIFVVQDGKTSVYEAKSIIVDKTNDLAIVKITDNKFSNIGAIPYTWSTDIMDVGTSVFAMGYPYLSSLGEEIKVTDGIISSKTGYQGDIATYQISAPIQPGNSGGPLFDKIGNLLGITSAGIPSLDNVGYAIKVSYLNNLIDVCPEPLQIPTSNKLQSLSFTEKIKDISQYVVIIKIY